MTVAFSSNSCSESIQGLTHSLESLSIHDTAQKQHLRARVLETIRNRIPLAPLFSPENKIDLGEFIESQMLFRKIAEFITTLGPVDRKSIARHFEKSPLLMEIKALFNQDPTPYLASLYDACADNLNKKPYSQGLLKPAIEDRIFTLREALTALHVNTIFKTQTQREKIKEEGESFIRECLRIHTCSNKVFPSFKAELISTAEQLIPFVRNITKMYLRENEIHYPDNPLSFRNPTGYNCHGLTAATVMEACLHALGYTTQVLARFDLEPKVTLATAHSIVEVTASDSSKYLVDPCYIQFHKDICMDEDSLPNSSVLVLHEDEVDAYIEEKLMVHWKRTEELVKKRVESVRKKLSDQDQIITYMYNDPEFTSENPEDWVRCALKRIWDIQSYTPIKANCCYQEIFVGMPKSKTHEYIEPLGIAFLSHYLPNEEVDRRLKKFLQDPKLKYQNLPEALSLLAQIPTKQIDQFAPLLNLDPRIHDSIGIAFNAYFRSLRKIVNPETEDLRVIYGCSGADCISVMLATDAQEFTFVDLTPISYDEFAATLAQMRDRWSEKALYESLKQSQYFWCQLNLGAAVSVYSKGKEEMEKIAGKFFFNLKSIGVDLDKVVLSPQNGNQVRIDFPWQYHGADSPRNRTVTFVSADITKPQFYPSLLKAKLESGFDIFYMKAAFFAPRHYPQFLPHIAKLLKPGGWLMTTDISYPVEKVLPETCLKQNGMRFALHTSEEKNLLEDLLSPVDNYPLCLLDVLESYPPNKRSERGVCPALTYWSILNLRKRML